MKTLLDTNILVHAYNKSSPHQKKASEIIRKAMQGEIEACLSPQVLYEFFAVVTSANELNIQCCRVRLLNSALTLGM
jgi:predicted nucleic acid-binding protein